MNAWLIATAVLLLCLVPCGAVCVRARTHLEAVVALQVASSIAALTLLTLAVGAGRSSYAGVAVVFAALDLAGGLVFVRFLRVVR